MKKVSLVKMRENQKGKIIEVSGGTALQSRLMSMGIYKGREITKLNIVALSGGVFCNRYLTNRLIDLLKREDFPVLFNREVPANDGGLSLGQAAIAAYIVSRGV